MAICSSMNVPAIPVGTGGPRLSPSHSRMVAPATGSATQTALPRSRSNVATPGASALGWLETRIHSPFCNLKTANPVGSGDSSPTSFRTESRKTVGDAFTDNTAVTTCDQFASCNRQVCHTPNTVRPTSTMLLVAGSQAIDMRVIAGGDVAVASWVQTPLSYRQVSNSGAP